jgi:hypothetical protein
MPPGGRDLPACVSQALGEPLRTGCRRQRQLDQLPHQSERRSRLHGVDPRLREVQHLRGAVDHIGGRPGAAGLPDLCAQIGGHVLRRPQPRGHRPERVRKRTRPLDRRKQTVEEFVDRGPHPWEFGVFGRQPFGFRAHLGEFRADGGQPRPDPLQPRVRLGQPVLQPGRDKGGAVGGPRRGPPAQPDRRGARQRPEYAEGRGPDSQ